MCISCEYMQLHNPSYDNPNIICIIDPYTEYISLALIVYSVEFNVATVAKIMTKFITIIRFSVNCLMYINIFNMLLSIWDKLL